MHLRRILIYVLACFLLSACRTEIKEERVKKESERSLEIALEYIKQQRALHEFDLNRKIRLVSAKINQIQTKGVIGDDTKDKLAMLQKEKLDWELKLKILIANTTASNKKITEKWVRYNQSLEAMLQNMQDYLKGIPIDKDTAAVKDSLPKK
jgi:predicted metal-dependent peptidase